MFSKSLTMTCSIALSLGSTLFSMGYILHDRMETSISSLVPRWNSIHPTPSQKEEWERQMMLGWWPPQ